MTDPGRSTPSGVETRLESVNSAMPRTGRRRGQSVISLRGGGARPSSAPLLPPSFLSAFPLPSLIFLSACSLPSLIFLVSPPAPSPFLVCPPLLPFLLPHVLSEPCRTPAGTRLFFVQALTDPPLLHVRHRFQSSQSERSVQTER